MRPRLPGGNLATLIDSVQEFINHHKMVDELFAGNSQNPNSHKTLTQRLSHMLAGLREVEVYLRDSDKK